MVDLPEMEPEEFLQSLLIGDLSPEEEAVQARLRSDPELAERWRELQATCADVDDAFADVRESLESSSQGELPAVDFEAAMGSAFPRRRSLKGVALLAAAVLVAILLWAFGPWRAAPDPVLGTNAPVLTPDEEASADYAEFSWATKRTDIFYYVVVVTDETGTEVDRSTELEEKRWEPGDSRRHWPDRIRWTLKGYSASDVEQFSVRAVTWRE